MIERNVATARVIHEQRQYNMDRGGQIRCKQCEAIGLAITEAHLNGYPLVSNPYNPDCEDLASAEAALYNF